MTQGEELLRLLADGSVRRAVDLRAAGIRAQAIANALEGGLIRKAGTGVYFKTDAIEDPGMVSLATACLKMPRAVVCLMSAAHLCGLVDGAPARAWLALPVGAHGGRPRRSGPRILRWSFEGASDVDVVEKDICGVRVRHTGPKRTIIDLIRYGARWGEPTAGILAARKFVAAGGDLDDVVPVAEAVNAPKATLHAVRTLALALS